MVASNHLDSPNLEEEGAAHPASEQTPLLAALRSTPFNHGISSTNETLEDDELLERDIDPNEFDDLLSRTSSMGTGTGLEPESQETAMLRGPRKYSGQHDSRRPSRVSLRRAGTQENGSIEESPEEDETITPKSPFLAGVSVGRFWLIFGSVLGNIFVGCFDSTIMFSSHPVITSYFHSSNSASWLSTAFLLTSTSFQPLFGRLSDTIGRKPPYIFSLFVFLMSTIWCALAQSMTSFIIARAVCGLGAGGALTMGSIITSDIVPIEIRGAYQSYINIVFGVASSLGAALGGAIADKLGWRWEFGIQVPALVICLIGAIFTIPKSLGLAEGVKKKTLWEAMKVFVSLTFITYLSRHECLKRCDTLMERI